MSLLSGFYPRTRRITILFVDQDEDNRMAYANAVEVLGHRATLAASALEAIDSAKVVVPDAVVMDVRLPDLDGFELTRRLIASPRTSAVPIVAVIGERRRSLEDRLLACGCSAVLFKPCPLDDLLQTIARLLSVVEEDHVHAHAMVAPVNHASDSVGRGRN
jgi:CheY-like chemotaxis protein